VCVFLPFGLLAFRIKEKSRNPVLCTLIEDSCMALCSRYENEFKIWMMLLLYVSTAGGRGGVGGYMGHSEGNIEMYFWPPLSAGII